MILSEGAPLPNSGSISRLARIQIKAWERTLSFRIQLQRLLDLVNKFPENNNFPLLLEYNQDIEFNVQDTTKALGKIICETSEALALQAGLKEPIHISQQENDSLPTWEYVSNIQSKLRPHWKNIINKQHARLNFGSEHLKSKLKVLDQSMWDQVTSIIDNDPARALQRSRMPLADSPKRILGFKTKEKYFRNFHGDDELNLALEEGGKKRKSSSVLYDEELYDDRPFYALLLKSFVTSTSDQIIAGGDVGKSYLNTLDEAKTALRQNLSSISRMQRNVDRKASKGRKIRYLPHKKLENFMFPIQIRQSSAQDSNRLFSSLFQ